MLLGFAFRFHWCRNDPRSFEKESAIRTPALTPYFSDSAWTDGWPETNDVPPGNLYNGGDTGGGMQRLCIARHLYQVRARLRAPSRPTSTRWSGGIMVGFSDGHVQPEKLNNLWNLTWDSGWAY